MDLKGQIGIGDEYITVWVQYILTFQDWGVKGESKRKRANSTFVPLPLAGSLLFSLPSCHTSETLWKYRVGQS